MIEALNALARTFPPGMAVRAARIWGGVEQARALLGYPARPPVVLRYARHIATARAACADEIAFGRAWQEGRAMSLEEIAGYALAKA